VRHGTLRRGVIGAGVVAVVALLVGAAIIAMARSLGLQTVAEGVEQEDQHAFLRDAGCDIGQGYLYGRPMPADALRDAWRS
jgi:EAL domain-containing protein (putative c-di-GMP-specific phosphodiesterase class I)